MAAGGAEEFRPARRITFVRGAAAVLSANRRRPAGGGSLCRAPRPDGGSLYRDKVVRNGGPLVTPKGAGAALVELVTQATADIASAYLLSGDGSKRLP